MGYRSRNKSRLGNWDQNDGKPGVVYILRNEAFKENWLKIGQTTKSGAYRASQLNAKASTGIPKHHLCVFELRTADCGRAEKEVHRLLHQYRMGRQEFFTVELEIAKAAIFKVCRELDDEVQARELKRIQLRQQESEEKRRAIERAKEEDAVRHARRQTTPAVSPARAPVLPPRPETPSVQRPIQAALQPQRARFGVGPWVIAGVLGTIGWSLIQNAAPQKPVNGAAPYVPTIYAIPAPAVQKTTPSPIPKSATAPRRQAPQIRRQEQNDRVVARLAAPLPARTPALNPEPEPFYLEPPQMKMPIPKQPTVTPGYAGFDPKCRWASPIKWTCE
jgi:hypothetical protein